MVGIGATRPVPVSSVRDTHHTGQLDGLLLADFCYSTIGSCGRARDVTSRPRWEHTLCTGRDAASIRRVFHTQVSILYPFRQDRNGAASCGQKKPRVLLEGEHYALIMTMHCGSWS